MLDAINSTMDDFKGQEIPLKINKHHWLRYIKHLLKGLLTGNNFPLTSTMNIYILYIKQEKCNYGTREDSMTIYKAMINKSLALYLQE